MNLLVMTTVGNIAENLSVFLIQRQIFWCFASLFATGVEPPCLCFCCPTLRLPAAGQFEGAHFNDSSGPL